MSPTAFAAADLDRHRLSLDDEDHARFAGAQKAIVEGRIDPALVRYDRLRRGIDRALQVQGVEADGAEASEARIDARNRLDGFEVIEGRAPTGVDIDTIVAQSTDPAVSGGGHFVPVAAGDLKCVGGSCTRGGSRGTTGMYHMSGKNLCRSCAVKQLGMENSPADDLMRALEAFEKR